MYASILACSHFFVGTNYFLYLQYLAIEVLMRERNLKYLKASKPPDLVTEGLFVSQACLFFFAKSVFCHYFNVYSES